MARTSESLPPPSLQFREVEELVRRLLEPYGHAAAVVTSTWSPATLGSWRSDPHRGVHHLAVRLPQLVIGVERDPNMVVAVWAKCHGIGGDAEICDVRDFTFGTEFGLVLAPMQLIQLLADRRERMACLSCVRDCMSPGARAAFALVEELPPAPQSSLPPLPDVREIDGWIYSSLPLEPLVEGDLIRLRRLRQTVDPDGAMNEALNEVDLQAIPAAELEEEAEEVGLLPLERREIPPTESHVGSVVVLLEAGK